MEKTAIKWQSIKDSFENNIRTELKSPSKLEKEFWVRCANVMDKMPDDQITPELMDQAAKKEADEFLREKKRLTFLDWSWHLSKLVLAALGAVCPAEHETVQADLVGDICHS